MKSPDQLTLKFHRREVVLLSQQILSSFIRYLRSKKECPSLCPLDICSKTKKCPSTVSMNPPESVHDAAIHTIRYYRNNYNRYNKELYYYFNVKFLNPRIISRLYLGLHCLSECLRHSEHPAKAGCCRWKFPCIKNKLTRNVVSDIKKGTKEKPVRVKYKGTRIWINQA
jgi:hypothetical protein